MFALLEEGRWHFFLVPLREPLGRPAFTPGDVFTAETVNCQSVEHLADIFELHFGKSYMFDTSIPSTVKSKLQGYLRIRADIGPPGVGDRMKRPRSGRLKGDAAPDFPDPPLDRPSRRRKQD